MPELSIAADALRIWAQVVTATKDVQTLTQDTRT